MKRETIRIGMISLGCSKNQVDAERLLAVFRDQGWVLTPEIENCDVVVVNTCGFIEDAKRESIEAILEAAGSNKKGQPRRVVVTGCLAERYRSELAEEMPEADAVLGIGCNADIVSAVRQVLAGERVVRFGPKEALSLEGDRVLTDGDYTAYVKVAEGCDNRCSYCAIPLIRGSFRSRPLENVVSECRALAARGVKEINLVAQDTTRYGLDLYGEARLPELLRQVCAIEELRWVRVLYCYPDRVTDALLDEMARQPKVCRYLDIPVQHGSAKVLREMNRRGDRADILALAARIREKLPGAVLRTTVITGFPGETEEDFTELCSLVQEARFDRLGCFVYSREEDTPAGEREDQVDPKTARRRADIVMELQQGIAFELSESQVGRTLEVLVEGRRGRRYVGRSYMDAPDIDTRVLFDSEKKCLPGDFIHVIIEKADGYDLFGRAVE